MSKDQTRRLADHHLDAHTNASQNSLFRDNSTASLGRLVYHPGMAALETDDPLSAETPPDFFALSEYDKIRWPRYSRVERKQAVGRAATRQTEEFNREHERQQRQKAAEEARARANLPVVPSIEECQVIVISNPGALSSLQDRVLRAYQKVRAIPGSPFEQIDAALGAYRRDLVNRSAAEMLRISALAELYFLQLALDDNELGFMAWTHEQEKRSTAELSAAESRRLAGTSFDASKFIANLAAKGIRLVPAGDDRITVTGNRDALTGTDIATIEANRTAITAALLLEVEI
jgi:hypothetical protein